MPQVAQRKPAKGPDSLAGKYRLIAELGQGGMATVFLAVMMGNSGFRKLAVVKLLRREMADDPDFVQMFLDEAKLCARLSHPNIVHTYDVGVDEYGHLMAMEYLDGVSLHAAIARMRKSGTPLKFPMQARVLLDVLEGLQYAHSLKDYDGRSLNIVHRDVTPQNIFVTYDGQVKLLDFGIAKAATSSTHTATGVIKGKLTYMAPEQARGDALDARADLYAIGVMLWEALSGRRRWPAGLSEPALYAKLATGEPPEAPGAAEKGYPAELDALILKSLATNPGDRFQTAAEFHDELERVMRGVEPVSLRDMGTTLAGVFAEGRERLRTVIEEQFRLIESGGAPSEPSQIPAVATPGHVTGSQTFGRPTDDAGKVDAQSAPTHRPTASSANRRIPEGLPTLPPADATHPPTESSARPMATPSLWQRGQPGTRRAVIAGVALALFVAAVAVAKSRIAPAPPVDAAPTVAAPAGDRDPSRPPVAPLVPAVGDQTPKSTTTDEVRAAAQESAQKAAATSRRPDVRVHPTPSPRTNPGPAPVEPVVVPPVASAAPTGDPATPNFRTTPTKPKVQLERDNPWP